MALLLWILAVWVVASVPAAFLMGALLRGFAVPATRQLAVVPVPARARSHR